jgi:nicotinate-nucleotide pyrophosphorylase
MPALSNHQLQALLEDDAPCGDLSTQALDIGARSAQIEFRARQPMTVCATEEAARLFQLSGAQVRLVVCLGTLVVAGELLLEVLGSAASLHCTWKAAQTLVEWASGIATTSASIVAAANGVAVACARKNVPGTKAMSVKAVLAGGGIKHQLDLSETLLVFGAAQRRMRGPRKMLCPGSLGARAVEHSAQVKEEPALRAGPTDEGPQTVPRPRLPVDDDAQVRSRHDVKRD